MRKITYKLWFILGKLVNWALQRGVKKFRGLPLFSSFMFSFIQQTIYSQVHVLTHSFILPSLFHSFTHLSIHYTCIHPSTHSPVYQLLICVFTHLSTSVFGHASIDPSIHFPTEFLSKQIVS